MSKSACFAPGSELNVGYNGLQSYVTVLLPKQFLPGVIKIQNSMILYFYDLPVMPHPLLQQISQ